mmetsp:Transcript_31428/g.67570  ORF Transcript_31428/g.67570 Transcript_31428/m.67570 type:complete len:174 (-) Transcript_31428:45-566(-)
MRRQAEYESRLKGAEKRADRVARVADHEREQLEKRLGTAISQRVKQTELLIKAQDKMKEMVQKHALIDAQAAMQEQLDELAVLKRATDDEYAAVQELLRGALDRDESRSLDLDEAKTTIAKLEKLQRHFNLLREDVGLRPERFSVPPREPVSELAREMGRQHMAAVLQGRGEC